LRFEDKHKDKDLRFDDKDKDKDLGFEDKDKDFRFEDKPKTRTKTAFGHNSIHR